MMDDELYMVPCPIEDYSNSIQQHGFFMSDHNHHHHHLHHQQQLVLNLPVFETHEMVMSDIIKAQIASHPLYSNLLSAYIECRKVGAPPEMASLLEEISKGNQQIISKCTQIGADPELDEFMISYCEVLHKYKEELSKPFEEATSFLSRIQYQLTNLCKETLPPSITSSLDEGHRPSDDHDIDCGYVEATDSQDITYNPQGDHQLKEMLMKKYSGYLSSLKTEFLKKRKKGKLPKEARNALLDWWNTHYRWPYPTEEEKNMLMEMTGLDQKQISNWFINQRKRHWKPSEDMRFALDMDEGPSTGDVNESKHLNDLTPANVLARFNMDITPSRFK